MYRLETRSVMSSEVELPEQGEIIIATISKLMDHGAYVTLDEYDGLQGFLHISEIAPGWIRSISKFVREGEKKVLLVKKVNPNRNDIDLSLKQVSTDQKKKKLLDVKREEKGNTLMRNVVEKAGLSAQQKEELEEMLYSKYDSLYDAFKDIAMDGTAVVKAMNIPETILATIEEICPKIKLPSVEIRGIIEITSPGSDGVEIIKKTLQAASKETGVKITYLGAPKYRLGITAPDFKTAEKTIKPIISSIQQVIEKKKGTFKFAREESKKTRVG